MKDTPPPPAFSPPPWPLRAVAFDLDGTLASSEDVYLHVGTETLRRRGKQFTEELRHAMMGRKAADALRVMIDYHRLNDTVETLAREGEELFWRFAGDRLRAMPGVAELLDELDRRQLPRGIATSGGRAYAQRVLSILGHAKRFAFVISADDVTHAKPHPEPYLQAAARLGVPPRQMLVLEDSAVGCASALAAGAYTVAAPNGHTASHAFGGVAFVADGLGDPRVLAALDTHG